MEPGSQKNSSKHQQHNNCQPVKPGIHLRAAAAAAKQHMHDPAVKHVVSQLGSAKKDTQSHAIGTILFGGVLFAAGAAPWALPWLFVLFSLTCLPWRAYSFIKQKWVGTTAGSWQGGHGPHHATSFTTSLPAYLALPGMLQMLLTHNKLLPKHQHLQQKQHLVPAAQPPPDLSLCCRSSI